MSKSAVGILFLITASLTAQSELHTDRAATAVLKSLAESVESKTDLTYEFLLTIEYPEQEKEVIPGQYQQKGEMYYLNTPSHQFVSDGQSKWIVDNENKEVQIYDMLDQDFSADISSPRALLKIYENPHYDYRLLESEIDPGQQVVEFKPIDKFSDVAKASLTIDQSQIREIHLINKDGSRYTLQILNAIVDQGLGDDQFMVQSTAYPDFQFEDLRIE